MIASVGSTILGSSRSSTRTSPGACITAPRMWLLSFILWCRCTAPGGAQQSQHQHRDVPDTTTFVDLQEGPDERCTGRAPQAGPVGRSLELWTIAARSATSSSRGEPSSPPDQVGLPAGSTRRVPGLRRSEVAALAGLSVEYYAKLERGALAGASAGVLDAIARAFQFDDAERAHLFDLARTAEGTTARAPRSTLVEAVDDAPEPPVGSRRRDRRGGLCPQWPDGPARCQPARPGLLRRCLRRPPPTGEHRAVHLPRPQRPALLPRVGRRRRHLRRHPADRSRPRPPGQGAPRPRRRALHPQRRLPHTMGRPQRPPPRHRHQAVPTTASSATSNWPTR